MKQPPPVRKRMDEEKCSGPNCRSMMRFPGTAPFGCDSVRMGWHRIGFTGWVGQSTSNLSAENSCIVSKVEQSHVFFVESFMFPFACRYLAPGSFFSHRKHWITLCVFQQINSAQRLRCQPHQRDQSSQRFVDTLMVQMVSQESISQPSKTAKNKAKTTPSSNTPWTNNKSTTLNLQKSSIDMSYDICSKRIPGCHPPPTVVYLPMKTQVVFPTSTVLTTWHH